MRVWKNLFRNGDKIHTNNIIGGTKENPIYGGNFVIVDRWGWSGDFNKTTLAGMYRIGATQQYSNGPTEAGVPYGQLLVIRGGADTCAQLIFSYQYNRIWYRSGYGVTNTDFGIPRPWAMLQFQ